MSVSHHPLHSCHCTLLLLLVKVEVLQFLSCVPCVLVLSMQQQYKFDAAVHMNHVCTGGAGFRLLRFLLLHY